MNQTEFVGIIGSAANITLPLSIPHPGMLFAGWSEAVPPAFPANDLTINAQWIFDGLDFIITWEGQGSVEISIGGAAYQSAVHGARVTVPVGVGISVNALPAVDHFTYDSNSWVEAGVLRYHIMFRPI